MERATTNQREFEIRRMYREGRPMPEIAEATGVKYDTLRHFITKQRRRNPRLWPYQNRLAYSVDWVTCKCLDCGGDFMVVCEEDVACPYCLAPDARIEKVDVEG